MVPLPRPYRRAIVVHSPDAFEAKRAAAVAAAAAAAQPGQAANPDAQVPPSVLAAGAQVPTTPHVTPAEEADLLGDGVGTVHDFGDWDEERSSSHTQADVHRERDERGGMSLPEGDGV